MLLKYSENKNLLCFANYSSDTGYAWNFIEKIIAGVATKLELDNVGTIVAYPKIVSMPKAFNHKSVKLIELSLNFNSFISLFKIIKFVHVNRVRVIYMHDRYATHPAFLFFRLAGVRNIVVHHHSHGARTNPSGIKYFVKWIYRRLPGIQANTVIGVSDFVRNRAINVALLPIERVRRVWNFIEPPEFNQSPRQDLILEFGFNNDSQIVMCASRATEGKGIINLLHAFDLMCSEIAKNKDPSNLKLVYLGDGPELSKFTQIRDKLTYRNQIIFAGYRSDVLKLIEGADLCVVPSEWDEAFCLAALEPMSRGIPVIASAVGAIPEVVSDGETGYLIDPGNKQAIAAAMIKILFDQKLKLKMGENGRLRAKKLFAPDDKINEITEILKVGFRP